MPSKNSLERASRYVKYQRANGELRTYYEIQLNGNEVQRTTGRPQASGYVATLTNYLAEVFDDEAKRLSKKLRKAREKYRRTGTGLNDAYLVAQLSSIINLIESDEEDNFVDKETWGKEITDPTPPQSPLPDQDS